MANSVTEDNRDRKSGSLEVDDQLVDDISALLQSDERGMLMNLIADLHPADLADLISHLSLEDAQLLFDRLPTDVGGDVLTELDSTLRAALLEESRPDRISEMLDTLDTDDATDILGDLSDEMAEEVLDGLEDAEHVRELLSYDEESAGGIMQREYVPALRSLTVAEVTEEVRRLAETIEPIYAVYVIDEAGVLLGVVSLKQLLLSPATARIDSLMRTDFEAVTTEVDQEEVARIMERYDLVVLPVVDAAGRLIGRITIDDVVDVIREEAEEDLQLMSGVSGGEAASDSVFRILRGRLPWLMIGLVGAGLSGLVIGSFEDALKAAVVLASFLPIMMATAGNVGIQSSSIVVQGLASGDVWSSDVVRRMGKETAVALVNGLSLASVLALSIIVLPILIPSASVLIVHPVHLAITAGLSLMAIVLLATVIGTVVPILLHRVGIDPALATGPFITTLNDILGLTVYFLIATFVYL
ncbi:MAG: magnesium transporter [Rhodothermales bacterium]|nr:magnesium transporter [Rhodothermales bacterium]